MLTCEVVGRGSSDHIMYLWSKDRGRVAMGTHSNLTFTPQLKLSDAGRYTCQVTVNSMTYNNTFNIMLQSK